MSQDHHNTPPAPDGSDWNVAKEKELDTLLDQACSLADQLKTEVGAKDACPATTTNKQPQDSINAAGIDGQLDEIDGLLKSAKAEVGADPATPQPAPARQPIPSFMAEFTEEAPPETATVENSKAEESVRAPQAQTAASTASAGANIASAPPTSVATATAEDDLEDDLLALSASTPRSLKPSTAAAPNPETQDTKFNSVGSDGLLSRVFFNPLVLALTLINRPFDRVGSRARLFVGYAAIIMLLAAVIVFAITLV